MKWADVYYDCKNRHTKAAAHKIMRVEKMERRKTSFFFFFLRSSAHTV